MIADFLAFDQRISANLSDILNLFRSQFDIITLTKRSVRFYAQIFNAYHNDSDPRNPSDRMPDLSPLRFPRPHRDKLMQGIFQIHNTDEILPTGSARIRIKIPINHLRINHRTRFKIHHKICLTTGLQALRQRSPMIQVLPPRWSILRKPA